MEAKYKPYFKKYINDIMNHYKLSKNDIDKIFSKDKILEFIKGNNGKYITENDLEDGEIVEKVYERFLSYGVAFDSMKEYYDKYIYMDKYGIGDFCIEKDNIYILDYLYNRKAQVSISNFIGTNYTIFDYHIISQEQKFDDVLEFLHLQLKRGNIKVRVLDAFNWNTTREDNIFKLVKFYNWKEYNQKNADNILKELKNMYLNAYDKNIFLEYLVEINLAENEWKFNGVY